MDGGVLQSWTTILHEFQALGGTAENVKIGIGSRGRGLFAIDPSHDSRIVVPPRLLINAPDIKLDSGRLVIKPDAAIDHEVRAFFERYQENFSFGAGAADDCRRILAARHQLPDAVQDHLFARDTRADKRFPAPTDERVFEYFLSTRSIGEGKLMPVLELANHSSTHASFDRPADGSILVSGRFADEILVRYSSSDTWRIFQQYGFACSAPFAYGNPGARQLHNLRLRIGYDFKRSQKFHGLRAPIVERRGDTVELSYLVLGNRLNPYLPKRIFVHLMHECSVPGAEELFDVIAHVNRSWFYRLLELLENCEGPMIADFRKAARLQLQTLSFCIATEDKGVSTRKMDRKIEALGTSLS